MNPKTARLAGGHPLDGFKVVGTRGAVQQGTTTASGLNTTEEGRSRNRITAAGLTALRMLMSNTYIIGSTPWAETPNPTDIPITYAIEWDAPAAFSGGTMTVPANASYAMTPDISAASLGLSSFDLYGVYWERIGLVMPANNWLQGNKAARIPAINTTGEFMARHNPAGLQVLATGAMVQAGGSSQRAYMPNAVIAQISDPNYKAAIAIGDSWARGIGGTDDTVEGSIGFFQKALMWDGAKTYASINCGQSSDSAMDFLLGRAHRLDMARLCTHALIIYGINDFVNHARTAAQLVADLKAIAALLRSVGIKKVAVANLAPKTTGTFATEAGQTSVAGWEAYRQAVNPALVVGPDFDAVLDASTACQGTDITKWAASTTTDGTHPSTAAQAVLLTAWAAILTAWGF